MYTAKSTLSATSEEWLGLSSHLGTNSAPAPQQKRVTAHRDTPAGPSTDPAVAQDTPALLAWQLEIRHPQHQKVQALMRVPIPCALHRYISITSFPISCFCFLFIPSHPLRLSSSDLPLRLRNIDLIAIRIPSKRIEAIPLELTNKIHP